jgi:hypothetical protein
VRLGLAAAHLRVPAVSLLLEIAAGGVVYVGSAFVIAGNTARDLLSMIAARRRPPPEGREPLSGGSRGG